MTISKEVATKSFEEYEALLAIPNFDHKACIFNLQIRWGVSYSSAERYVREGRRLKAEKTMKFGGDSLNEKRRKSKAQLGGLLELCTKAREKTANSDIFPILVIPDLHIPFHHPSALQFCTDQMERFKCKTVVCVGDEVDNHALSFHTTELEANTADQELSATKIEIKKWFEAFPDVSLCVGNHSKMPVRRAKEWGLPKAYLRSFHELFGAPETWKVKESFIIGGVHFSHAGKAGYNGSIASAIINRRSSVFGHNHAFGGVQYQANNEDVIFGFNAGCLIDIEAYAFAYGKDFPNKPTLGCGIVHSPVEAQFVPMTSKYFRSNK